MDKLMIWSVLLLHVLHECLGFKSLLSRIPNAAYVMNPCDTGKPWEGIGHLKPGGYGQRNQFGLDFKLHGLVWRKKFCMLDSDGDGRTNGEELGDPLCVWISGGNVSLSTSNVTHPGICEPLDSDKCKGQNSWLKCENEFKCDAINEPDTKKLTIRLPSLPVPLQKTTHYCMLFDLPQDGDYHMVATQPFLDNKKVMHHIIIYGCSDDKEPKHKVNEPYECGIVFDSACQYQLSVWLLGTDGECMHKDAGFRIGTHGYKRAGLQIHWENQQHVPGLTDSSGTTIYYTPKLRQHDAGILFIGQDHMIIPPGEEKHVETGSCYPECTRRKFSKDIHVTFAINHMHYLGREMKIELLRNNKVITTITDESHYDYDSPLLYRFDIPITVRPGDEIKSTCTYNSTTRDTTTRYGPGYLDEMCYGFLTFYPRMAVTQGATFCTAWDKIPICLFELDDKVEGCDFRNVHNMSNPTTRNVYDVVMKHCRPYGPCYKECRHVMQDIVKMPCYHGNMWKWSRDKIVQKDVNTNDTAEWFKFYAAMDSCSQETSNKLTENVDFVNSNVFNEASVFITCMSMICALVVYVY